MCIRDRLNTVIHFGPSLTIEDYFQETGRAGRNGEQSYAILFNYTGCTRSRNITSSMKQYLRNESFCRRKIQAYCWWNSKNDLFGL